MSGTTGSFGKSERSSGRIEPDPLAERASSTDERALVEALRRGDESAFAKLVGDVHPFLMKLARMYVNDPEVAAEIVQDTWVGVLRGIDGFEQKSSLRTWIFRILVNRAKTRARREGRTVPFSQLAAAEAENEEPLVDPSRFQGSDTAWPGHWSAPPTAWSDPERRLQSKEILAIVQKAIDELPPVQRAVITLRDLNGLTPEEVCNVLEISETNERVLVHRARAKVRNAIEAVLGKA